MMDKRTLLAFAMVAVLIVVWTVFLAPKPEPPKAPPAVTQTNAPAPNAPAPAPAAPATSPTLQVPASYQSMATSANHYVTVETPLYTAIINTRGGMLARMELKRYKTWHDTPVQLICDSANFPGVLGLAFTDHDGRKVSTEGLAFTVNAPDKVTLGANDSVVVDAVLSFPGDSAASPAASISKRFVFRGSSYAVGFEVGMKNMASRLAANGTYEVSWRNGVKYQEHNSVEESQKARAMLAANDDHTSLDATEVGTYVEEKSTGNFQWIGSHVKYFGAALVAPKPITGAVGLLRGTTIPADSSGHVEVYDMSVTAPAGGGTFAQPFTLFAGPMEYDLVHDIGIASLLDLGNPLTRPISEYVLLPLFRLLHSLIGNYGIVIIVFSLIIRLVLWPLSIPQIRSSRKMQLLQPKVTELRAKHADDQQRQQMEMMRLYREYGINPMGGCLPMVLQLPILYALWNTLSAAIDLRQTNFLLWIHDLSVPDYMLQLPMHIPILGDKLSGLALIMGVTLFFQQRMMITDPKQKALVYMMPLLLTLAFNNLPSGLNLYYLTFNILSIGQQVYLTKFSRNPLTLDQMREEAKSKKKGWLAQKLEDAQKMAEAQRGPAGSNGKVDGRTAVEPRKKK